MGVFHMQDCCPSFQSHLWLYSRIEQDTVAYNLDDSCNIFVHK